MAQLGHNSGFASKQLISLVERIERLNEEKSTIGDDLKEVYSEAKGQGFDTKIIRMVIAMRKIDTATLQERDALIELYWAALEGHEKATLAQSEAEAE